MDGYLERKTLLANPRRSEKFFQVVTILNIQDFSKTDRLSVSVTTMETMIIRQAKYSARRRQHVLLIRSLKYGAEDKDH